MTILGTIYCNFKGCSEEKKETKVNEGWKGWGAVKGRLDEKTGSDSLGLCPKHCDEVYDFVTGGD